MTTSTVQQLLAQATQILPLSEEELIQKGIAVGVSERIFVLKQRLAHLQPVYGGLSHLEQRIQAEGVSPDDHTLYTDLLEWRATKHEVAELLHLLEI